MPVNDPPSLAFYAQPAMMTSPGRYAAMFDPLPRDAAALASVGHGLLVHEHLAALYGLTLSDDDRASVHIRPVERLLERIVAGDDRPLTIPREAAARVVGNCRHFTVLIVAMLRAQGTAARARCGFGGYFTDGFFEDHWVCEYWHATQQRWVLVDAQIDELQRDRLGIDFDVADVPRDRFLTAGEAWARCRAGTADPDTFGLTFTREAGYWWIAGNLMRDAAALRNIELLPWDVWGAMPAPNQQVDDYLATFFDQLAALTRSPDDAFADLQRLSRDDDRLRVPPKVRNDVRGRNEDL